MRIASIPRWSLTLLALVLALGFLGSRGIWDPDEGRYTNVALTMLDSGDWLNPMRNEDTGHWTKPPLTYWLIASSVLAFGHNTWAARLPMALAYLACIFLVWRCARRLQPGTEDTAALVYMTMALPFGAGQMVTTDFPLAAAQALAMYGFVEYRFGDRRTAARWLLLMWAAFALAFMVKGPPALIPLLAIAAFRFLQPAAQRVGLAWHLGGIVLFLALALPWFIDVAIRHDGLMQYFLGAELVDRVATDRFGRHGEWYGWIEIYVPTLVIGTLPWSASLWRWARALPSNLRRWRARALRQLDAEQVFIALWIVVPLIVFCVARSRLPLYLLPIFLPIAIAIALQRRADRVPLPRWPWLAAWVVALLGLRLASASFPTHKDASVWAEAIRARAPGPVTEVVFVEDMARYGLHLHLGVEIEKLSLAPLAQPRFNPEYDEPLIHELEETGHETGLIYVAKIERWPQIRQRISEHGYLARALGTPFYGRVLFEVRPSAPADPQPAGADSASPAARR